MVQKYIDFIINEIIKDAVCLNFNYGWNIIIIPYFYWLFLFLFKYLILTSPIWILTNMILSSIKLFVKNVYNNIKN